MALNHHTISIHPGKVLLDELEERGITQSALAAHIGVLSKTINEICRAKRGISAEIIDLATLSPIDIDTILDSVARTGRLVIVHEAARNLGVGAEIAALVAERGLYDLQAPIQRVAGFDTIMPLFKLEHDYIPSVQRIIDAVEFTLAD